MTRKAETQEDASGIAHVSKHKLGYDVAQVDAFLERAHKLYESQGAMLSQEDIQNAAFDWSKGGYMVSQVDAALARLEQAVVDKQTRWELEQNGLIAWKEKMEELYRSLDGHAQRSHGVRFKPGEPKKPSYDRKQVDRLIDQVMAKVVNQLGVDSGSKVDPKKLIDISSKNVSNVIFTQRKGKSGYDERQVDYYLNFCAHLLGCFESYTRIVDFDSNLQFQARANNSASGDAPANGIRPLFSTTAQPAAGHEEEPAMDVPQSFAPVNDTKPEVAQAGIGVGQISGATSFAGDHDLSDSGGGSNNFDTLHRTEEELFRPPENSTSGDRLETYEFAALGATPPSFNPAKLKDSQDHRASTPPQTDKAETQAFNVYNDGLSLGSGVSGAPSDDIFSTGNGILKNDTGTSLGTVSAGNSLPMGNGFSTGNDVSTGNDFPTDNSTPARGDFPSQSTIQPQPGSTDGFGSGSSLSSLTHMPESSLETSTNQPNTFIPKVPSLKPPTVNAADPTESPTFDGTDSQTGSPASSQWPYLSLEDQSESDMGIPDLSFPSLGHHDDSGKGHGAGTTRRPGDDEDNNARDWNLR